MKVKNRLALQFTLMFAILLFIVLSGIFISVDRNRKNSFYSKLDYRALIVGELYLAQDNMTNEQFRKVIQIYPQTLSHETTRIYNDRYHSILIREDSVSWSNANLKNIHSSLKFIQEDTLVAKPGDALKKLIGEVIEKKRVHLTENNYQIAGLYYQDNSGNFVIIASAVDDAGLQEMHRLLLIMIFSYLSSLAITFVLGRIFATIALQPILKITNDLKIIRSISLHRRLTMSRYKNDEINKLSDAINNLLEHLEQSFSDQQSFISNASHELGTPVTKILGTAEVALTTGRDTEDFRLALQNIITESEKLHEILNSLLELAQADGDNSLFQKLRLDELLWEAVDETGNAMNETPNSSGRINANYNARDNPDEYTISGNRRLLFIAISNILKNALKFSGDKTISCNVRSDRTEVSIDIEDMGVGIPESEVVNIFKPFYRAANASAHRGMGIGLSLAEKIIRLHNGTIHVRSVLGKGTTFTITFSK
ncbi:MAG: HAMP domain-containing histidine kinase [Bacteroidia bacterium]|nr:HAMP domain-containing histidine kinase [Bacteroidia bacterium]